MLSATVLKDLLVGMMTTHCGCRHCHNHHETDIDKKVNDESHELIYFVSFIYGEIFFPTFQHLTRLKHGR